MIKKHLEIKTYHAYDVNVTVKIDYDKSEISLIEHITYADKKWLFSSRGLEYMNGWLNVLESMKYAITEAKNELKKYQDDLQKERDSNVEAVLMEATKIVKKKSNKK
jgi:hypothetical protein